MPKTRIQPGSMPNLRLQRDIHRVLASRLFGVVAATGVLFAVIAFIAERDRLEDTVMELARLRTERFNHHVEGLLEEPEPYDAERMQAAMDDFVHGAGSLALRDGRFVLARVYDRDRRLVGRIEQSEHPQIEAVRAAVDEASLEDPAGGGGRSAIARLHGRPHVGVALDLLDGRSRPRALLVGVFAVSDAAVSRIRGNVVKTVSFVVGLVVLTALAIYPVISGLLGRVGRTAEGLLDANLETLQVLGGAIAKRDSDTDAHNHRVTLYAVRLAEAVGLPREQIRSLVKGALLHDVGKLGIRDEILLKPGKLTDAEFTVMQRHVTHGLDITDGAGWLRDAQPVVGGHHEKFDGSGYPGGLVGSDIPTTARVFAIVDVFDALTSRRPYKEPMSFTETLEVLERGRGRHFDPDLLDAFAAIAPDLFAAHAGQEGDGPKRELEVLIQAYFKSGAADLLD